MCFEVEFNFDVLLVYTKVRSSGCLHRSTFLDGSRFEQAVDLHRIKVTHGVHLRDGLIALQGIDLVGAKVGGSVDLDHSTIISKAGNAINATSAKVGRTMFFRNVKVVGNVNFLRVSVGGNLNFTGSEFSEDINLQSSRIADNLVWKDAFGSIRKFDLTNASIKALDDNETSWSSVRETRLGGFSYQQLSNPVSVAHRQFWLENAIAPPIKRIERGLSLLCDDPENFDPRPYTQLAKVLREDGLDGMAAQILEAREDCQRDAEYLRAKARLRYGSGGDWVLATAALKFWSKCAFKRLFGYGHAPARVLVWIGAIWALGFILYGTAYQYGEMAPNSDVLLSSDDWMRRVKEYAACLADCVMPLRAWEATPAYQDYETFHPMLYALDLFVPLDALGQENAWAPSKDRGWWGTIGYYARMPIQMSGWIITAMSAAVVTGLVGRKE